MFGKKWINTVNNTLFFDHDEAISAELGLILGCRSISLYVADEAVTMYKEGRLKKLAISGGNGCSDWITKKQAETDPFVLHEPDTLEADAIEAYLLENGVKPEDIVCVDREATNTGENIVNCLGTLKGYDTTLLIAPAYSQRRAVSTYRRYITDTKKAVSAIAVYPMGLTQNNWHTRLIRFLVMDEYNKVTSNYIKTGYIVETDPKTEAARLKQAVDGITEQKSVRLLAQKATL